MKLLLSNDDGIIAPGLRTLMQALQYEHDVWVSAPDGQCSAQSHLFSLGRPLKVHKKGKQEVSVEGSPADSVYYGLHGLMTSGPEWVVSGINAGSNLGTDVHYSGTVGAAMEGVLHGVHGLAVSLHGAERLPDADYEPSAQVAALVLRVLQKAMKGRKPSCWNLNIPLLPVGEMGRVRLAALSRRIYSANVNVVERGDGYDVVRLGGKHLSFEGGESTDGPLVFSGYPTLTRLDWNWTSQDCVEEVGQMLATAQASP